MGRETHIPILYSLSNLNNPFYPSQPDHLQDSRFLFHKLFRTFIKLSALVLFPFLFWNNHCTVELSYSSVSRMYFLTFYQAHISSSMCDHFQAPCIRLCPKRLGLNSGF